MKYAGVFLPCEQTNLYKTMYQIKLISFMIDFADYLYEHPGLVDLDLQGMWASDRA